MVITSAFQAYANLSVVSSLPARSSGSAVTNHGLTKSVTLMQSVQKSADIGAADWIMTQDRQAMLVKPNKKENISE